MNSSFFLDEPLVVPFTSGEVLVRLAQIIGTLERNSSAQLQSFQNAQTELLQAIKSGDHAATGSTLRRAQDELFGLYQSIQNDPQQCEKFGFPTADFIADEYSLGAVNVQTVTATFVLTGKQVLTSIAFERAANARFYWLHEVRHFADNPSERVEDPIIETSTPFFDRLRLAPGPRVLRIKARNLSTFALSDEFTVDVPFP